LDDPEVTSLALHEYNAATNMTEQFAALTAIAQNPGQARDDVLADFYTKWSHDYLVEFHAPILIATSFIYPFSVKIIWSWFFQQRQ